MALTRHTLSVLVEDKPGVLARVAALFSRRGFNIESLAVGPTEHPTVSRMTIVVAVEDLPLEQVTKQLNKLINVLKIVELDPAASVQRELLLVKVKADLTSRSHVLETVQLFRAKVVDVAADAVTIEATGTTDKLAALIRVLEPFGIRELVQSGMVAVGRGGRPRLRQPGPRPRAVAARLRRGRPRRPARGLQEPGQGRAGGPARRHAGRGRRRGRRDHDPGARHRAAQALRG
jgi:acetolactate synthase-1/3 small subunit